MGNPALWLAYGILAITWYKAIEQKLLNAAIRRGDIEGGLNIIRWFHFYSPDGGMALSLRGRVLLRAGKFREAEELLRQALASLRSNHRQAQTLEVLGDALTEQGRYDEAMRSYEAALHAAPGYRRPYRGMAELTLRRGRDAARAMEYVEKIPGPVQASWNPFSMNGKTSDDYWALKAWALASLGRGADVPPAVAEAVRRTNLRSKPDIAATYHRVGLALETIDRKSEAREYLLKAREADPYGTWAYPT